MPNSLKDYIDIVYEPDDIVEVRFIWPKDKPGGGPPKSAWAYAKDLPTKLEKMKELNKKGWGVYAGVNPRKDFNLRGDENVALARCLFCDFDDKDVEQHGVYEGDGLTKAESLIINITNKGLPDPDIIVSSGAGVHAYWRLTEPLTDLNRWVAAQKGLIAILRSDKAIKNPERIMRLPGFYNTKREPLQECFIVAGQNTPITIFEIESKIPKEEQKKTQYAKQEDTQIAELCLKSLKPARANNYSDWLEVGMAIKAAGCTCDVWDQWSKQDANYEPGICEKKWDSFNGTGGLTIASLITWARNDDPAFVWPPRRPEKTKATNHNKTTSDTKRESELIMTRASGIERKEIVWLIPNRIPAYSLNLIVGNGSAGKSWLTTSLISSITTGTHWPDCENTNPPSRVLLFNDEDDPERVIIPRLQDNGAKLELVDIYDTVITEEGTKDVFDVQSRLIELEKFIDRHPDTKLIIFDPITAYLGYCKENSNSDVRAALLGIQDLAQRREITIIGVNHLSKKTDLEVSFRVLGSTAFIAAPRSVWGVVYDKPAEGEPVRWRKVLPIKNNYSVDPKGLRFEVQNGIVYWDKNAIDEDIDDSTMNGGREAKATNEAIKFLEAELVGSEPKLSKELIKDAKEQDIEPRTLTRAAKKMGVKMWKSGLNGGKWVWSLKNDQKTL